MNEGTDQRLLVGFCTAIAVVVVMGINCGNGHRELQDCVRRASSVDEAAYCFHN